MGRERGKSIAEGGEKKEKKELGGRKLISTVYVNLLDKSPISACHEVHIEDATGNEEEFYPLLVMVATQDIGVLANSNAAIFINEYTAATFAYRLDQKGDKKNVFVVNLRDNAKYNDS
ncbi:hypothetical protein VNO77_15054 [Canavalia gladiata]|uniref:Uncharacterized protein n=1 Tax=Canavalia gladiata TaxID=3824 RepID=A0AAN9QR15_CANGL